MRIMRDSMKLLAAALGSALLACTPVNSQKQGSDADAAMALADEFVACAGFFHAMSETSQARRMTADDREYYRGLGRGAELASAMLLASVTTPELAGNQASIRSDTQRIYWANLWASASSGDEQAGATVKLQAANCVDLNPVQSDLVKEARKRAYLSAE